LEHGELLFHPDKFHAVILKRMDNFGLQLAVEKLIIIQLMSFKKESSARVEFIEFEFRWGVDRKGCDVIKRKERLDKNRFTVPGGQFNFV
jgi:hypothetical protein